MRSAKRTDAQAPKPVALPKPYDVNAALRDPAGPDVIVQANRVIRRGKMGAAQ